jgi:hypothetical protein
MAAVIPTTYHPGMFSTQSFMELCGPLFQWQAAGGDHEDARAFRLHYVQDAVGVFRMGKTASALASVWAQATDARTMTIEVLLNFAWHNELLGFLVMEHSGNVSAATNELFEIAVTYSSSDLLAHMLKTPGLSIDLNALEYAVLVRCTNFVRFFGAYWDPLGAIPCVLPDGTFLAPAFLDGGFVEWCLERMPANTEHMGESLHWLLGVLCPTLCTVWPQLLGLGVGQGSELSVSPEFRPDVYRIAQAIEGFVARLNNACQLEPAARTEFNAQLCRLYKLVDPEENSGRDHVYFGPTAVNRNAPIVCFEDADTEVTNTNAADAVPPPQQQQQEQGPVGSNSEAELELSTHQLVSLSMAAHTTSSALAKTTTTSIITN